MTVKTAISVEETLFERAEALAKELSISRSRLFALAVEEFIEKYENQHLLRELNAVYGDPSEEETTYTYKRASHRKLVEGQW